jgi:hypothetical protein
MLPFTANRLSGKEMLNDPQGGEDRDIEADLSCRGVVDQVVFDEVQIHEAKYYFH